MEQDETVQSNRKGLLIAVIALVVVLVGGLVGYRILSGGEGAAPSNAGLTSSAQASSGKVSDPDAIYLADYDARIYTASGVDVLLTQVADGKPLVMNFWATWCPYCIREMDDYKQIYEEYQDRVSFAFIDCADGTREKVADAAAWLRDNGYDVLPAYYDTELRAAYTFGAMQLPTTVVVAADGEILAIQAGAIDPALMRSALDSLI